jgi:uncharacterized OB-fold protein
MTNYRKMAAPTPDPESQEFWDGARAGKFLVRRCTSCSKVHWFPRTICPFCGSAETEWMEGSGKGTIYTYTVMHRAKEPYAAAYVELDEGPKMLTNIVDCDLDAIKIGLRVGVIFVPTTEEGPPVPCFKPI